MKEKTKTFLYAFCALIWLILISFFRSRLSDGAALGACVVFAGYNVLMCGWAYSLKKRLTQKNMLRYMLSEIVVLEFWLVIRLLQGTVFADSLHITRVTGYLIVFPLVLAPLLGFYASLGLGMSDTYRIPGRMLFLIIPAAVLILAMVTNERHGFVFRIYSDKEENLEFHPNIGIMLIILWAAVMIILRIGIIRSRTRRITAGAFLKNMPLVLGIAVPAAALPYLISDFAPRKEFIEFTAQLYFLEAMTWESCILSGMVPVNTNYGGVFELSTVGMQIVDDEGGILISSRHAVPLTEELFSELCEKGTVNDGSGQVVHLRRLSRCSLIYRTDVSEIMSVIQKLHSTEEELRQESSILSHELKTRSEKARIHEQNNIYDLLTGEVEKELSIIDGLLSRPDDLTSTELFSRIIFIGTYIKRRCGLSLIIQQGSPLRMDDLKFTLYEFSSCFGIIGTGSRLDWQPVSDYTDRDILAIAGIIRTVVLENEFDIGFMDFYVGEEFRIRTSRRSSGKPLITSGLEAHFGGKLIIGRHPDFCEITLKAGESS